MPKLYILCGIPASGKSNWARRYINAHPEQNIKYVSRDEIRFSLVKENQQYFSREKEVFNNFINAIATNLNNGYNVIADATHVSTFARKKVTLAIDQYIVNYQIVYVVFNINIQDCLFRNATRLGRAMVPDNVIRNMCRNFHMPSKDEDARVIDIIEIGE